MALKQVAVVGPTGIVENIVLLADGGTWSAPEGSTLVPITANQVVMIGGTWDGTKFTTPVVTPRSAVETAGYAAEARFAELAVKGWANLSVTDKAELAKLSFDALAMYGFLARR